MKLGTVPKPIVVSLYIIFFGVAVSGAVFALKSDLLRQKLLERTVQQQSAVDKMQLQQISEENAQIAQALAAKKGVNASNLAVIFTFRAESKAAGSYTIVDVGNGTSSGPFTAFKINGTWSIR